jgi:hypothetical protein
MGDQGGRLRKVRRRLRFLDWIGAGLPTQLRHLRVGVRFRTTPATNPFSGKALWPQRFRSSAQAWDE